VASNAKILEVLTVVIVVITVVIKEKKAANE
jgi:hypothetical protein